MTKSWLEKILTHPLLAPSAIALGIVLLAGTLKEGLLGDDYIMKVMMEDDSAMFWGKLPPWDLYSLLANDPAVQQRFFERGVAPWWGSPSFKLAFFRPLSSLSIYLDHQFPAAVIPWLIHLDSLIWLGIFLFIGIRFLRRFMGNTPAAGLAILLFALDDAHVFPAFWAANRNSLIASVPAVAALLVHDQWRRGNGQYGYLVGPGLFALALLGGEFGVGILGFFVAYALFLDPEAPKRSFKSLVPYFIVLVCWRVLYSALGYGASGSDIYIDPLARPVAFGAAALSRIPLLLLGLFGLPHVEISSGLPQSIRLYYGLFAVLWTLWAGYVLLPFIRQSKTARFFAAGMLLALIPCVSAEPSDRLLLLASLGSMGLLGLFLGSYFKSTALFRKKGRLYSILSGVFLGASLLLHLVVSPVTTPLFTHLTAGFMRIPMRGAKSLPSDSSMEDKTVVLLTAPDVFASNLLPIWRRALKMPVPRQVLALTNGFNPVQVARTGETELTLTINNGHFGQFSHDLFRQADQPMRPGHLVHYPGMKIEVLRSTPDGDPIEIRTTFDAPLEDPRYLWFAWGTVGYVPFTPPKAGTAVVLDIDERKLQGE